LCAGVSFAQSPAATAQTSSSTTSATAKPSGPEAVARTEPNRVVATINGKQITAREAADLLKAIPPDQLSRYQGKLPNVLEQLYMGQDLAHQAEKMNLDKQSPVKEQLELSRNQVLAQAYLNKIASNAAGTAADPAQYYNSHPEEFDRVDLSGIFIGFNPPGTPATNNPNSRTEEQARAKADDIEKKLKAGGDFSTIARTDSDNQQSAANGGKIGTVSMAGTQLPADLKTALQNAKTGDITAPVRIPNGYLIAKVDSRKKLTLDEARPEITQKLQSERNQAALKQEIDKYKIQVQDPDFFGSTASSTASTPSLQKPGAPPLATGVPAPHKP
jgi:hypothetical protein